MWPKMKDETKIVFLIFCCCFYLVPAKRTCDLSGARTEPPSFPDLEAEGTDSYQMSVEYSMPGAFQTDYYSEYYDIVERRGRVDSHQNGKSWKYIYMTESGEAFEIFKQSCNSLRIDSIPEFLKDAQDEWIYENISDSSRKIRGPSAMFRAALDDWNLPEESRKEKIAYMGESPSTIRGLKAQYYRRCLTENYAVDYYFTLNDHEEALGFEWLKRIPLRVVYNNTNPTSTGEMKELAFQEYDIITFQPFISDDNVFQLEQGKECKRYLNDSVPEIPDLLSSNLKFSAEVIYRVDDESSAWTYYSILMMSLDVDTNHLAYSFTKWTNTSQSETDTADVPEYIIYDMKHKYAYKTNVETGKCNIIREEGFTPQYELPNNGGTIDLNNPEIIFTNNELYYLDEGQNRGLKVNVFEATIENYSFGNREIPKLTVSHSYLADDEVLSNTLAIKNALTQVQLNFKDPKREGQEILTFNFFSFDTEIINRRQIFDITKCFKNDDDYMWVTIGFPADPSLIAQIEDKIPFIQSNLLNDITLHSELNAARIPIVMVDVSDGLYVTMLMLGKPPIMLDYLVPVEGATITKTNEIDAVQIQENCATNCLESKDNCWGFSICGNTCYFGVSSDAEITTQEGCKLYKRFNNETFIPSKESMALNLRREVEGHQVRLAFKDKDDNVRTLEANYIDITDPGQDDSIFSLLGNELNPRMRVLKAGAKLKGGEKIKRLGKLRYEECQKLCLDFTNCETVSYCLSNSDCILSSQYNEEIGKDDIVTDYTCALLTRKYADHFVQTPGVIFSVSAVSLKKIRTAEECARACLKETEFDCLSFDYCPADDAAACRLHMNQYTDAKTKESMMTRNVTCGHFSKKYSIEFKKSKDKRMVGKLLPPVYNVTLEECSKLCKEYGEGKCFGFDFCQDKTLYATSCFLLDKDPQEFKSTYSPICSNFIPIEVSASSQYSYSYAGGIGFFCFLIGGLIGAGVVFVIAYIKMTKT